MPWYTSGVELPPGFPVSYSLSTMPPKRLCDSLEDMVASEDPPEVPMSLEESVLVRRAHRRALAAASGCEVGSVTSEPSVKKKRGEITLAMTIAAKVNGLVCGLCLAKDTDPDPVAPQCRILWAHYGPADTNSGGALVVVGLTTQGLKFAYCDRTGKARFNEYKVDEMKIQMGKSEEVCQTFHRFRKWLIQTILEHFEATGDREKLTRVTWPNHTDIHHVQITEVVWIKPEDDCVELASCGELKAGDIVETAPMAQHS